MAPEDTDNLGTDALDDLDLDAAIGAAEGLAGQVDDGMDVDLDSVLNADSGDESMEGGPRRYDFNRPHNISRTFEHSLQAIGENFAKIGSIDFTSLLRMSTNVEFTGLSQSTFSEYQADLPNPTCVSLVKMSPLKGNCLINIDLGLSYIFLKKLMGGFPDAEDTLREFTEIERGINAGLVKRFLEIFRKSMAKKVEVEPDFVSLENNPTYLSGIAEGEMLIVLKFLVKLDTIEGPVEMVFPLPAFGPVRDIFDPQEVVDLRNKQELREDRRRVMEMVQGTECDIMVQLAEIDTTFEAIMNLAVGDMVNLPQGVDAPLKVHIEGQAAWLGEAGRIGQNRAVKLHSKCNKE
ncbi:MAG: FliM/FliN family flagellar motor switch protein [Gemmatimonadales bacterium]|nr:FliM/FliN family flagellar motor switch protein [Gemmatimonadales bacterium]